MNDNSPRRPDLYSGFRLVALVAAIAGVVLLAAAAFILSYSGIHRIALTAGVSAGQARIFPVIFDAMLVVGCAAILSLRGADWWLRAYAWLVTILLLIVVATADAWHAIGTHLPHRAVAATVAVIPWVLLLIAFTLLLAMLRQFRQIHLASARPGTAEATPAQATGKPAATPVPIPPSPAAARTTTAPQHAVPAATAPPPGAAGSPPAQAAGASRPRRGLDVVFGSARPVPESPVQPDTAPAISRTLDPAAKQPGAAAEKTAAADGAGPAKDGAGPAADDSTAAKDTPPAAAEDTPSAQPDAEHEAASTQANSADPADADAGATAAGPDPPARPPVPPPRPPRPMPLVLTPHPMTPFALTPRLITPLPVTPLPLMPSRLAPVPRTAARLMRRRARPPRQKPRPKPRQTARPPRTAPAQRIRLQRRPPTAPGTAQSGNRMPRPAPSPARMVLARTRAPRMAAPSGCPINRCPPRSPRLRHTSTGCGAHRRHRKTRSRMRSRDPRPAWLG